MNDRRFTSAELASYLDAACKGREFQFLAIIIVWAVIEFDDHVHDDEKEFLISACNSWDVDFQRLAPVIGQNPADVLVAALQVAQRNVVGSGNRKLLEIAILASLADDKIVYGEILLLEMIADALQIERDVLHQMYRAQTGGEYPTIGDPSSVDYYKRRASSENRGRARHHHINNEESWLKVLGLTKGAKQEEIRQAYRKMALIKHPDRFPNADEATKKKMHDEFLLIKKAYDALMASYA